MLCLRTFNRFILISLALLGLSVSTGASAKTYLVEFQASASSLPDLFPYWDPNSTSVGDTLFDFTIEDDFAVDTPTELRVSSMQHPAANLRVYNWGVVGQHGTVTTPTISQGPFLELVDNNPRNGGLDEGVAALDFLAPDPLFPNPIMPPELPTDIQFWAFGNIYGMDQIRISNGIHTPFFNFLSGEAVITEISAVPVPAAVWLFGTALIGLVGFGKRRKVA